ncbi:MAG: DNA mismatch repair endonuclease MutL [Bacteroidota bacterium]
MSNIIQMLPDSVANQIAAGEVIQRPASVVKELIENAIDASATEISVIVKDSGRTLIQVIDNGKGMTDVDARVSFERHATSKIKRADELFSLKTKGFRGEALASIAAVAQVELKTKTPDDDLGTIISIEGSMVKKDEPCQAQVGSSFSVKNLFFNVPARRNFLKSDSVEMKHIIDEFQRVAIPHHGIHFKLYHNGNELFNLPGTNVRQRLVAIFGNKYDERLVPVDEHTDIVSIKGFVGKPAFAKRTRGEQFFFVNDRFIKSTYLNHAVVKAFEDVLPAGSFPFYCLMLEVDTGSIDVNIHPTKTEIKFEDERAIYAILRSSIRQALGKYNVAPSLDFDQEMSMNIGIPDASKPVMQPTIEINPNYNPFDRHPESAPKKSSSLASRFGQSKPAASPDHWKVLYEITQDLNPSGTATQQDQASLELQTETDQPIIQLHRRYMVTQVRSGLMMIDQHRAHQRVLFEQFMEHISHQGGSTQQSLFPETIELSPADHGLVVGMKDALQSLGFDLDDFGNNTIVVRGIPSEASERSALELIEGFLENVKHEGNLEEGIGDEVIAKVMSKSSAISYGKSLSEQEMRSLIDQLFACQMPGMAPDGRPVVVTMPLNEIDQKF